MYAPQGGLGISSPLCSNAIPPTNQSSLRWLKSLPIWSAARTSNCSRFAIHDRPEWSPVTCGWEAPVKSEFPQFLSCSSVDSVSEGGTGTKVTSLLSDLVPRATEEVE